MVTFAPTLMTPRVSHPLISRSPSILARFEARRAGNAAESSSNLNLNKSTKKGVIIHPTIQHTLCVLMDKHSQVPEGELQGEPMLRVVVTQSTSQIRVERVVHLFLACEQKAGEQMDM